jgi:hypothetical protein
MTLGTSPLKYQFKLVETTKQIFIGGAYVTVKRRFTEGLVRAELDGLAAERRVSFSGEPLMVDMLLPPAPSQSPR